MQLNGLMELQSKNARENKLRVKVFINVHNTNTSENTTTLSIYSTHNEQQDHHSSQIHDFLPY